MNTIYRERDTVYHWNHGCGIISAINRGEPYPLLVEFKNIPKVVFTEEGYDNIKDSKPTLSFTPYTLEHGGFSQERPNDYKNRYEQAPAKLRLGIESMIKQYGWEEAAKTFALVVDADNESLSEDYNGLFQYISEAMERPKTEIEKGQVIYVRNNPQQLWRTAKFNKRTKTGVEVQDYMGAPTYFNEYSIDNPLKESI